MSKIVQVVNTMLNNPSKITNVQKGHDVIFFNYIHEQLWGLSKQDNDQIILSIYPQKDLPIAVKDLVNMDDLDWKLTPPISIAYSSESLKESAALESFTELYKVIIEKLYGIDDIFDQIIQDGQTM
jgi:hypothetical protein